jgi:hypothetical protein
VEVDPAALKFDLVDLALAVLLTTSMERQRLSVPREVLERGQHVLNCHSARVAGCVLSSNKGRRGRSGAALFVPRDLHRSL